MAGDVSLVEVMARLVAAFAMIIGLLGGAVYVFRRRGMIRVTGGVASTKRMKVVERQTLSLVRVGASSYLVGSTDQHVSMLADVTETVTASEALEASAAEAAEDDPARQGTGAHAGHELLHSPRMDLVGAILQRMNRRV
jgi:flagellar protein FliO/FliZ